jgi:hypothetical protein
VIFIWLALFKTMPAIPSLIICPSQRTLLKSLAANLTAFGALHAVGEITFAASDRETIEDVRVADIETDGLVLKEESRNNIPIR